MMIPYKSTTLLITRLLITLCTGVLVFSLNTISTITTFSEGISSESLKICSTSTSTKSFSLKVKIILNKKKQQRPHYHYFLKLHDLLLLSVTFRHVLQIFRKIDLYDYTDFFNILERSRSYARYFVCLHFKIVTKLLIYAR